MNKQAWISNLKNTLKILDITNIKNLSLYEEAFCHKTYANEQRLKYNQQRLEFLGDAAIGWVISNYVFSLHPKIKEGDMTIIKSKLVCTGTLAKAARELKLEKLLMLGKGAAQSEIRDKTLEDTFEAFVGAIAQDQGIKKVIKLIDLTLVKYHKENLIQFDKDNKTRFQELIQSTSDAKEHKIEYIHEDSNCEIKRCILKYCGNIYGVGEGSNFKEAEQNAAKNALDKFVR